MKAYERIWTGLAAVVTAAGLFAAFRGYDVTTLLGMFLAAAVLVVMWVLPFIAADTSMVRPLVRAGLAGGMLTWVAMGAARLVGAVGVVVVLVLVATSPPVVRWCGRVLHGPRVAPTTAPAAPTAATPTTPVVESRPVPEPRQMQLEPPEDMTDAELCQAWRRSFVALRWATTPASRLPVVAMRARYLDELERRAGPRFHAWLEHGARAAGDPSRLLESHGHDAGHDAGQGSATE